MALAIDSEMPSNVGGGFNPNTATTVTQAFTNTAGTYLLVGVSWGAPGGTGALDVSGATYAGSAMTLVEKITYDTNGGTVHAGAALFGLLSPSTGNNNIIVTMTAATNSALTAVEVGAISFTGNHATTPIVASSANAAFRDSAGTTASVATGVATTSGNIVVAQMATGSGYVSTSQTLSWSKNVNTNSAGGNAAMTRTSSTGSTVTMTDTVTSDSMGIVVAEVAAAAGGGFTAKFRKTLSGIGSRVGSRQIQG